MNRLASVLASPAPATPMPSQPKAPKTSTQSSAAFTPIATAVTFSAGPGRSIAARKPRRMTKPQKGRIPHIAWRT